jgi:cytochrome b involved in lipid metabolism
MVTKKISLNELKTLVKQIIKEEYSIINERLGDKYLDTLFYEEYPKTEKEILLFLKKHEPKMSADEKKYHVDKYLNIVKRNI